MLKFFRNTFSSKLSIHDLLNQRGHVSTGLLTWLREKDSNSVIGDLLSIDPTGCTVMHRIAKELGASVFLEVLQ